ncbi:MAG: GWxTD domain-containing protein [bacterium]|nr:GWxTD domain-containing protein [bacterium]
MKNKIALFVVLTCFVLAGHAAPAKKKSKRSRKEQKQMIKNLEPRYKLWLNMTRYLSLDQEKSVFMRLTNNRERDIFIRSFWLQRDPTPGTIENEYKNEIEERFRYVRKYFKRGSSKPGWMTDMGRFWMILGKPNSIERYESNPGMFPAQVWYYFGDQSIGLPTYFSVMYYKPYNTTEWKFYNPSVEGPSELLIQTEVIASHNYQGLYNKIRELVPELAMPAFTMIPNEIGPNFNPPLRNNLVVNNIYQSPTRKINASYATHFLNYKGFVDVESSVNYIANTQFVSVTRYDRFGFNFVNISLKPKAISVGYSEERSQYYFSYDLSINLKKIDAPEDEFIFEEKNHFDFYIDEKNVNGLKSSGLVLHHSFPAIPGKYKLTVFAMNTVGKEFTYFDKVVDVPPVSGEPVLAIPVIGYKTENQPDSFFFTYLYGNKRLLVDTGKNFRLRETPQVAIGAYNLDRQTWQTGKVLLELKGLNERNKYQKSYEIALKDSEYKSNMNLMKLIGEEGLNPDYYELEIKLVNGSGKILDTQSGSFSISPVSKFNYPMESFKKLRVENPYFFYYTLATQYEKSGGPKQAEQFYQLSIQRNPGFKQGYVRYLSLLNKRKDYTGVMGKVEKIAGDSKFSLEYRLIKATALFGLKNFQEALDNLLKANTIYDSDTRVLNLLGFTLLNLKQYDEALKAFNASLKLNDKQQTIHKTVSQVKQRQTIKNPGSGPMKQKK